MTCPPRLINGGISVDDRGQVSFVNDFNFDGVKRFYLVANHRSGTVRAWHGHEQETKYVTVVKGAAVIGVVPMDNEAAVTRFTMSAQNPAVLCIPAGNYNGFMTLTDDAQLLFFSTATREESLADDIRADPYHWDIWNIEER